MAGMPEVATQQTLFTLAGGKTDVGRKRDHNEDQVLINEELGLYAVADGMGGHQAGDVASSIAAASLEEFFWKTAGGVEIEGLDELHEGARRLAAAIHHCNHQVFARSGRSANQGGMGSTVVAIHVDPHEPLIHIAHVGDSRCYRIRGGKIEQLTRDHSMINEALRLNPDLSEEILKQLPSNVVTRALGTKEDVQPDVATEKILPGDTFLLCSDGLSGEVSDEDMLFGILESDSVTDAAELLVAMANEAGGRDNISAVVVTLTDGEAAASGDSAALAVVDARRESEDDGAVEVVAEELSTDSLEEVAELERRADEAASSDEDGIDVDEIDVDDDLEELDQELDDIDDELSDAGLDESEVMVAAEATELDEEELAALEDEAPPSEDDTRPVRRRQSLADLEPPFGSVSTVSDRAIAAEAVVVEEDNPYSGPISVAKEATADHFRSPASAIVELGPPAEPEPELDGPRRHCLECGHVLLAEEKFCGMCGAPTEDALDLPECEACGSIIYPDTRFCVECGVRHGVDWY